MVGVRPHGNDLIKKGVDLAAAVVDHQRARIVDRTEYTHIPRPDEFRPQSRGHQRSVLGPQIIHIHHYVRLQVLHDPIHQLQFELGQRLQNLPGLVGVFVKGAQGVLKAQQELVALENPHLHHNHGQPLRALGRPEPLGLRRPVDGLQVRKRQLLPPTLRVPDHRLARRGRGQTVGARVGHPVDAEPVVPLPVERALVDALGKVSFHTLFKAGKPLRLLPPKYPQGVLLFGHVRLLLSVPVLPSV